MTCRRQESSGVALVLNVESSNGSFLMNWTWFRPSSHFKVWSFKVYHFEICPQADFENGYLLDARTCSVPTRWCYPFGSCPWVKMEWSLWSCEPPSSSFAACHSEIHGNPLEMSWPSLAGWSERCTSVNAVWLCIVNCLFACLSSCLFACLFVCLLVCLLVSLFACLFACLFVWFIYWLIDWLIDWLVCLVG